MKSNTLEKWRGIETQDDFLNKDLEKKDKALSGIFDSQILFGTSGVKAKFGAGTNKMNVHTVAAAASAYAKFLKSKLSKDNVSIVVGHDNRQNSKIFSEIIARVMSAAGIKVLFFPNNELQPTPLISFAIRDMKLDGGISITAPNENKDFSGLKLFNKNGALLSSVETNLLNVIIGKIDILNVEQLDWDEAFISPEVLIKYINIVSRVQLSPQVKKDLNVVFTAQHGASAKIASILLEKMTVDFKVVEKQNNPDPNFKYVKNPSPSEGKSFKRAEFQARKNKSDLILSTSTDGGSIGIAVKYEKRYKYLNGNQIAALYLNYKLTMLKKMNSIPKDPYIVTTHVSGHLARSIAKKFGVKIYQTEVGFGNISNIIEQKGSENFIFAYEESYGFLNNANISRDKDALQMAVGIIDMVRYLKSIGKNLYSQLKDLYKTYGIHRSSIMTKQLEPKMQKHIMKTLVRTKKIGTQKVAEILDHRKSTEGNKLVKLIFESGSWIALSPSGSGNKVKIYIQTVGSKDQKLIDIVRFEKVVEEFVKENTEEFSDKKFSWKTVLKYTIFVSIIVGIMFMVFDFIYQGATDKGMNAVSTWSVASSIANEQVRTYWLLIWGWSVAMKFLDAWSKKRMFQVQGERVKARHLVISSLMGSVIAFVTPFAIGGDAIGYWYLRRKGVKRGPLIATLTSSALLQEAKFTLQTIFLASIGWKLYQNVFGSGDPQATGALIFFFVGLFWTIFSTSMIFMLTLSKRIQEFVVRNSIKFLEWFRWTHIYDPGGRAAGVQYEFFSLRRGMKLIWSKWWFPIELIFYKMIPLCISPISMSFASIGLIDPKAGAGIYWSQIVSADISNTANSMSITPGGSGTGEWLSVTINKIIIGKSKIARDTGYSATSLASGRNLLLKIFYDWPWLVFSTILIVTIIIMENVKGRVKKVNKKARIYKQNIVKKTHINLYVSLAWVAIIAVFIILFYLVFLQ